MAMLKFLSPTLHAILMAPAGDDGGDGGGGGGTETPEQKTARETAEADAKKKADEKIDPLTLDIKTAIEKARKQEKDKLYGQIEEGKKSLKTAEDLALARENENKTLKKQLEDATAKLQGKGGEGEGDDDKKKQKKPVFDEELLNKAIDAAVSTTAKTFEDKLAEAQKRIDELQKGNETKDLNTFREELISKNKDYIVPELVTGTTRDEIEQSLVTAKQVFARVTQGLKKDPKPGEGGEGEAKPRVITLPPVPNVNDNGAPGAPRQVDVKQLSAKDYKANRADLLKAAAAAAREALTAE